MPLELVDFRWVLFVSRRGDCWVDFVAPLEPAGSTKADMGFTGNMRTANRTSEAVASKTSKAIQAGFILMDQTLN